MKKRKKFFNRLAILFSLVSFASYSISDTIGKYSTSIKNIDYISYLMVINLVSIVLAVTIGIKLYGISIFKVKKEKIKYVLLRCLLNCINLFGALYVLSLLPLEIFYSIVFTSPLFAIIFAHFLLKEYITKITILVFILGFLGIVIVLQPWNFANFSANYIKGIIVALILPVCISSVAIVNRKYLPKLKALTVIFYSATAAFFVSIIFIALREQKKILLTLQETTYPTLAGIFVFIGAYLFFLSCKIGKVQNITIAQYTQFIWAILFSFIIFNHSPALTSYIGMFLVVCANIINVIKKET